VKPFALLIKPAGPDCNLTCPHCFYSRKSALFAPGPHRMRNDVLERLVKDYLGLRFRANSFIWQGGEPTLMGLSFYKSVVELQSEHGAGGQVVSNSLQTNGMFLDDAWCRLLKEYKWLVGISLDGPQDLHDHYRKDAVGNGSFEKAMAGVEACRRNQVHFNILTLVTDNNCHSADRLFDFYVQRGFRFVQLIPCAEKGYSPQPQELGAFLCAVFDRWLAHGPGKMSVRLFDSLMMFALNGRHSDCTFGNGCDDYLVVEHDGSVYPCDFFVDDAWRLGNIMETPIEKLAASEKRQEFASRKRRKSNKCLVCRWNELCSGGCPKDRLAAGGWSEPSCFCEAYKQLFEHAMPRLTQLAAGLQR